MMRRRTFEDVLDAALDVRPALRGGGIGTAGLFAASMGPWWRGTAAFGPAVLGAPPATGAPALPSPAPEPLLRVTTDAEHRAWRRLQHFGAGLPLAFTATHLKRAFRRLARQLHPDGHPSLDAAARASLCRDFSAARDAYEVLLTIGR